MYAPVIIAFEDFMNDNPQQNQQLPLFYSSLLPLSSQEHIRWALHAREHNPFAHTANAIPITVDEFVLAQKHYPIVFGPGDNAAPLALVGLQDGENLFCNAEGVWRENCYIPAYVRRYPFLLARLTPDAKDLSLCFDDQSGLLGPSETPNLFDGDQPSETTKSILQFCEQFEVSVQRTRAFMDELKELDLIAEGEARIEENGTPMTFRGFRMVQEQKLQDIRGDQARKLVKSGALGLIYAHFFSLPNMRDMLALKRAQTPAPVAA
jgi:hypothetical protein